MSPLGNLPLSSPHSHGSSSHVSPWVIGEGTCTCQYNEWVHTVPPTYKGERLGVAPPPLGGMGIHPMPPVRGGHGSLSHVPPQRREGLIFAPPFPISPHSHGSSSHVPPPLGYLPLSTPHSHGSSSHAPPLDRGHGSSSHVPLKKEEGDEGCPRVPPLSY